MDMLSVVRCDLYLLKIENLHFPTALLSADLDTVPSVVG